MAPSNFRTLVKNFTALTPEELATLQSLAGEFPYSQLLHVIIARGKRDAAAPDQQSFLHRAAVYSTDRSVVKQALTRQNQPRLEEVVGETATSVTATPPSAPTIVEQRIFVTPPEASKSKQRPTTQTPAPIGQPSSLDGDALLEDLTKELDKLQHLKHNFEAMYESLKQSSGAPVKMEKPVSPETAQSTNAQEAPLIEEIKATRRKLKVPSPKVAEQGEIIDQFIKVVPTLPKAKPGQPDTDLAEESVNYSDNIVSETLVEILLKQGKKAKAIEMLKKLIWKFPQKKAYFAAQIEALKN